MSADRLERRLPEVLTDLALPVMPDYIDTLLSRTSRMSQRPRWSLLERWIPVSTFEATLSARRPASLRPVIVLAILAAVIAASLVWYVGSQKRLPPLYGPARNGLVVTNSPTGDIVSVDPATGDTRTLVAGPNLCCVSFSPNGQYFDYLRVPRDGADPTAYVIATAEGTTVRELSAESLRGLGWGDWSPASDKVLLTTSAGPRVLDVATGALTRIEAPVAVDRATWIGTSGDILMSSLRRYGSSGSTLNLYRLAAGATSGAALVTSIDYAVEEALVSPDGTKVLYFIWANEDRLHGRLHVYDLTSGDDIAITSEAPNEPEHNVEGPVWSPDGSLVAAHWFFAGYDQLGISPATGGDPIFIGPRMPENGFGDGSAYRFSPDGKSLLVHFGADNTTWLLPVNGQPGTKVPWSVTEEWGWQRLAP